MTKLEEIERAMFHAYYDGNPTAAFDARAPWFSRLTRAAVEAMREPNPLMYTIANDMEVNYRRQLKSFDVFGFCGLTYVAMIDAILNEKPE